MTEEEKIAEYRAGHAERMKIAQAKVDENLRKHAEEIARAAIRVPLIAKLRARIEKHGAEVHDGNCCERSRIDFDDGRSVSLEDFEHADDPGLLVLEVVARMLERDGEVFR